VGAGEGVLGPVSRLVLLDLSVVILRRAVERREGITHGEKREALETLAWDNGY